MYRTWRCTAVRRQQENNTIHKIGNHPVIKRSSQVLRASEGAEPPAQRRSQPQWSTAALVQSCSQPPPSAVLKQSAVLQPQHNIAASHGRPPKHGGHGRPPKPGNHGGPPEHGSHDRPPKSGSHGRPPKPGGHDEPPKPGSHGRPPEHGSHDRPPKSGSYGRPPKPGNGKPPRYQKGDILGHHKNTRNLMTPSFLGSPLITLKICS